MIMFSRKLENVYVMYEKAFSSLVCVCIYLLIFAYKRPIQVSPHVFYFSISCINE